MLYIITEDSNSARVFWEIVVNEFRGKNNYILVPLFKGKDSKDSGGNTTLKSQVTQLIDSLNTYDELLVVFDNINNSRNFNKVRFIKWALNICKIYNINIRFTDYYCFEEVYLSYSELIDMYMKCNYKKIVLDTLKFVNASITNYKDYYDRNNKVIDDFINYYKKDSGYNREHFANALLIEVTQTIGYRFKIIKSGDCFYNQGACWLLNCEDIRKSMKNEYEINSICKNRCKFKCKDCVTKEKLVDLNNNSILKNSTCDLLEVECI